MKFLLCRGSDKLLLHAGDSGRAVRPQKLLNAKLKTCSMLLACSREFCGSLLLNDAALEVFSSFSQELLRGSHLELHGSHGISHTLLSDAFRVF